MERMTQWECIRKRKKGKGDQEILDERQMYFNNCGFGQEGIKQLSATRANVGKILRERGSEVQRQVQFKDQGITGSIES